MTAQMRIRHAYLRDMAHFLRTDAEPRLVCVVALHSVADDTISEMVLILPAVLQAMGDDGRGG